MSIEDLMNVAAKLNGFKDSAEMYKLIASVDISTPAKLAAFTAWKEDGRKSELLKLIEGDSNVCEVR